MSVKGTVWRVAHARLSVNNPLDTTRYLNRTDYIKILPATLPTRTLDPRQKGRLDLVGYSILGHCNLYAEISPLWSRSRLRYWTSWLQTFLTWCNCWFKGVCSLWIWIASFILSWKVVEAWSKTWKYAHLVLIMDECFTFAWTQVVRVTFKKFGLSVPRLAFTCKRELKQIPLPVDNHTPHIFLAGYDQRNVFHWCREFFSNQSVCFKCTTRMV